VLPPEKTPLLAKTYLLFERGAAEEPAASSTRPWPSSVDGLLAFYCWKLLTAGRCLLLLEALLLRRQKDDSLKAEESKRFGNNTL